VTKSTVLLKKDLPPDGITGLRASIGRWHGGLRGVTAALFRGCSLLSLSLRSGQKAGRTNEDQAGCENDLEQIAESEFHGVFRGSLFDSFSLSSLRRMRALLA
jgi:hypothetical protein